jgi:lipoprotein NlpI
MQKAISYAPKHQLAYFNLGIVTLQGGDMQGSQEWFAKCIAIDSTTESARRAQQLMQQHSFTNP